MRYATLVPLALALAASAIPARRAAFTLQNGQDAIALNEKFKTLTEAAPCNNGEQACIRGGFAICANGKFLVLGCARGTVCAALPSQTSRGTSIACDTQADINARIAATGATTGGAGAINIAESSSAAASTSTSATASTSAAASISTSAASSASTSAAATVTSSAAGPVNTVSSATENNPDLQNSLTLDVSQIVPGFLNDGQSVPAVGQVPSLTSGNNYINFCATSNLPKTNGQQVTTGSCNACPMGFIPSKDNMPSAKFTFPVNGATIPAKQAFTVKVAVQNFETGHFVNAQQNYFSAPQQLNSQGQIQGHSHVVIELLDSLIQTAPTDPRKFAFFKGLNAPAVGGILTADVTAGLPAGVYRATTINTAANHQPVVVPIAQHGTTEDAIYFTVIDGGATSTAPFGDATSAAATSPAATDSAAGAVATTTAASAAAASSSA